MNTHLPDMVLHQGKMAGSEFLNGKLILGITWKFWTVLKCTKLIKMEMNYFWEFITKMN